MNYTTILYDERESRMRQIARIDSILSTLPKGNISIKHIAGKEHTYLQYREGKKVICKSVSPLDQTKTALLIKQRTLLETQKNELSEEVKQLDRLLGPNVSRTYYPA